MTNLSRSFGEPRAIELMDAWMRGWFERDSELQQQTRHAMKGAD